MITINDRISIPDDAIVFEASTSSGPGGQHVNRVQTRVTLLFDLNSSEAFNEQERLRIQQKLATRITKAGILQVRSERHRSQSMNREDALARFVELLSTALEEARPRRKTRVSRAAKRRRLDDKKRHSDIKRNRRRPADDD
jgi:ribosome-associated protein